MSAVTRAEPSAEVMSHAPAVGASPLSALALEQMPTGAHFRRDHFPLPGLDRSTWRLAVGGSVERPLELALEELQRLPRRELTVVLECAGHRRSELRPEPAGIPWRTGAVSEAVWAGTPLAEVLEFAGLRAGAQFVLLEGADRGPFRGEGEFAFARALPLEKALHPDTLLAWEMNSEPLPEGHGLPVRAVVPGWYATDSIKWLARVAVLDRPFEGPFEAVDYRIPSADGTNGTRLTNLAVHALFTSVADGDRVPADEPTLRGIAWGGDGGVASVELSIDGGEWAPAALERPAGTYARVRWSFPWHAVPGLHTVAVRATDGAGTTQPESPRWNPSGYANSSVQRLRVLVESR
jgi:DMSO/TMAO reductase YedYZ molybdopterin-dependent catalytic subunit